MNSKKNAYNMDPLNLLNGTLIKPKVAIVIINGQRYHEGDRIQNLVIDKIESKTVTFVMGNTKIIKNVGK